MRNRTIGLQGDADNAGFQRDVAQALNVMGLLASTPTNASTQASGTGETDWNVNLGIGEVEIDGYWAAFAAQADYAVHATDMLVAASESVYARLVAKLVGTTVSLAVVLGTPATTDDEVEPTDAEVQTELGASVHWVDVALLHLTRDATTTLTQWQRNTVRNHVQVSR